MSFGGFDRTSAPAQPMGEINVTPLVDVMLVLLVIFIITAPLLSFAIKIDLPVEQAPPAGPRSDTVRVAIDAEGTLFWNAERIEPAALRERLAAAAARAPQPELHLSADRAARYERIALVLAAAQQAGLARVGFVTDPAAPDESSRAVAPAGTGTGTGAGTGAGAGAGAAPAAASAAARPTR